METLELFLVFFKIGFLSFGGGWTVVGLINHEVISHGWLSPSDFPKIVSVSQLTPGPVAVNVATYVGFRINGILGSIFSTLGILSPSILIIVVVSVLSRFIKAGSKELDNALRVASVALISLTFYSLFQASHGEWLTLVLAGISFVFFVKTKIDPVYIIILSAVLGAIVYAL